MCTLKGCHSRWKEQQIQSAEAGTFLAHPRNQEEISVARGMNKEEVVKDRVGRGQGAAGMGEKGQEIKKYKLLFMKTATGM